MVWSSETVQSGKVTVTVYPVVEEGLTVILAVVAVVLHRYPVAPVVVASSVTEAPLQMMPSSSATPLDSSTRITTVGDVAVGDPPRWVGSSLRYWQ
ncbi:MAG: hypothetical protein JPMHGGIA_02030 [Saprospiraceae bacterium]|nr:hypothetical protein [Saprospiraceae bacterium]